MAGGCLTRIAEWLLAHGWGLNRGIYSIRDWIEPREFLRTSSVLCLLGWPSTALAAALADSWPWWAAMGIAAAGMVAAWYQRFKGARHAAAALTVHLLFGMAPVMLLMAILVGLCLWPDHWAPAALTAYGVMAVTAAWRALRLLGGIR